MVAPQPQGPPTAWSDHLGRVSGVIGGRFSARWMVVGETGGSSPTSDLERGSRSPVRSPMMALRDVIG
jgi:hypothetical protein